MSQSNPKLLSDKVCIITGAAGLIGKAFSLSCAAAGARVVMVDIQTSLGKKAATEVREKTGNKNVVFQSCDITKARDIAKVKSFVVKKWGRIDALVNNAYPHNDNYGRKFEDVTHNDFCENLSMHVGGYFLMAKEIAEIMAKQKSGVIVNMGSIYGLAAPRFEIYAGTSMTVPVEYAAIKGGIINLTRYLASYLGKYNIRVNSLSPGGVQEDSHSDNFVEQYSKKVVLGRMAKLDDLTGPLIFLLSDESKYITGQNLVVDGGWSL